MVLATMLFFEPVNVPPEGVVSSVLWRPAGRDSINTAFLFLQAVCQISIRVLLRRVQWCGYFISC